MTSTQRVHMLMYFSKPLIPSDWCIIRVMTSGEEAFLSRKTQNLSNGFKYYNTRGASATIAIEQ